MSGAKYTMSDALSGAVTTALEKYRNFDAKVMMVEKRVQAWAEDTANKQADDEAREDLQIKYQEQYKKAQAELNEAKNELYELHKAAKSDELARAWPWAKVKGAQKRMNESTELRRSPAQKVQARVRGLRSACQNRSSDIRGITHSGRFKEVPAHRQGPASSSTTPEIGESDATGAVDTKKEEKENGTALTDIQEITGEIGFGNLLVEINDIIGGGLENLETLDITEHRLAMLVKEEVFDGCRRCGDRHEELGTYPGYDETDIEAFGPSVGAKLNQFWDVKFTAEKNTVKDVLAKALEHGGATEVDMVYRARFVAVLEILSSDEFSKLMEGPFVAVENYVDGDEISKKIRPSSLMAEDSPVQVAEASLQVAREKAREDAYAAYWKQIGSSPGSGDAAVDKPKAFLQLTSTNSPCVDSCCSSPTLPNATQANGMLGADSVNDNIHNMFTLMFFLLAMFLVSKVWRKMNKTHGRAPKNGESAGTPLASFSQLS